ncbi:MAG: hypothetical protein KDA20_12210 [Phycisphaerales bacterium]|nr:hypothetical protein [Phycisphaerales bacterium]
MRGWLLSAMLCATAAIVGCSSADKPTPEAHVTDVNGLRFVQASELDATRPLALGARVGLEHHAWLTDDTDRRVARVLSAYEAEPVGIDGAARARLRRSGFRVVAVPIEQVMEMHQALPPKLTWRREWAGQLTGWAEVLRGRSVTAGQRLIVDGREVIMPAGTPRFVARAWAAPTSDGAVLRTEVGVQVDEAARRDPARAVFDPRAALTLPAQGRLLDGASFEADLRPTHALIIVGAPEAEDWSRVQAEAAHDSGDDVAPVRESETPAYQVLSSESVIDADVFGPAIDGPQELGVYMLGGLDRSYRPMKAILVLIPRVPDEYRVLP